MTEGSTVKTKRMVARFFKNPPQPFMCIRDTLMGSPDPCYVNILSWDKVAFAGDSSGDVPLYGGIKLCPPRTEKKDVSVFAVMVHPEVLKQHGKNAHNPKERTWLIDFILDFVQKMNAGVVFNRRYTVLRDRDITGELKEIWIFVQNDPGAQLIAGSDEVPRPVPQYSHYQEQQQQQMSQTHQHSPQQQQQHHQQQQQQQQQQFQQQLQQQQLPQNLMHHFHDEQITTGQPPCYNASASRARGRRNRYVYPDSVITSQNPQHQQQNCLAYQTYQYQQLPRPMGPPFSSNIRYGPPGPINCSPTIQSSSSTNIDRPEVTFCYEKFGCVTDLLDSVQRKQQPIIHQQQQQQQQQQQYCHQSPSGVYYETHNNPITNVVVLRPNDKVSRSSAILANRGTRPFAIQHTTDNKSASNMANTSQSSNPLVNAQSSISTNSQISGNSTISHDQQKATSYESMNFLKLSGVTQIFDGVTNETSTKKTFVKKKIRRGDEDSENSYLQWKLQMENRRRHLTIVSRQNDEPTIIVKSGINDVNRRKIVRKIGAGMWDGATRILRKNEAETSQEEGTKDRSTSEDPVVEVRMDVSTNDRQINGNVDEERNCGTTLGKIASTTKTTNARSAVKIYNGGTSDAGDDIGSRKKPNGQIVGTQNHPTKESNEEVPLVYTILRKPEASTSHDNVTGDIAQLSINESADDVAGKSGVKGKLKIKQ